MPTAYKSVYVTLGGLMGGSRAIDCFDHDGLTGIAKRHAGNTRSAGVAGSTARQPILDELEVVTEWRVNGRYDQDNGPIARSSWVSNFYSLRATLLAVLDNNTLQTVTLTHPGGSLTGQCQIVDVRGPQHEMQEIATWRAVLLIPAGSLS